MSLYKILPGLPPYGPEALPFSATGLGTHSEGFVIRFTPELRSPWVGNFQPGPTDLYEIISHPDSEHVFVIAGGQAYVIHPSEPESWDQFGGSIEFAHRIDKLNAVLFGNGLWFELVGRDSTIWRTHRISWDGMRDIEIENLQLTGRSWCFDDTWSDFTVDLVEGAVIGGSYTGPGAPDYAT